MCATIQFIWVLFIMQHWCCRGGHFWLSWRLFCEPWCRPERDTEIRTDSRSPCGLRGRAQLQLCGWRHSLRNASTPCYSQRAAGGQQCASRSSFNTEINWPNWCNQTKATEWTSLEQLSEEMGQTKICFSNLSHSRCWIKVHINLFYMRDKIKSLYLQHSNTRGNICFDLLRNMTWLCSQQLK